MVILNDGWLEKIWLDYSFFLMVGQIWFDKSSYNYFYNNLRLFEIGIPNFSFGWLHNHIPIILILAVV